MPQLSPMMGFLMFMVILSFYFVLLCGVSKKAPLITTTKMQKSSSTSLSYFK